MVDNVEHIKSPCELKRRVATNILEMYKQKCPYKPTPCIWCDEDENIYLYIDEVTLGIENEFVHTINNQYKSQTIYYCDYDDFDKYVIDAVELFKLRN